MKKLLSVLDPIEKRGDSVCMGGGLVLWDIEYS